MSTWPDTSLQALVEDFGSDEDRETYALLMRHSEERALLSQQLKRINATIAAAPDHWTATAEGRVIDRIGATICICHQLPLDPVPPAVKADFIARAANKHARLAAVLAQIEAALRSALLALSTVPRFRYGQTDSYKTASQVEAAIALLADYAASAVKV